MGSYEVDVVDVRQNSRRRREALAWATVLLIGWVVFDLTADPAITAVVTCTKFGLNDWLTARWLRKSDPVRRRGSACAWFYRASALWKVAIAATVGMFLLVYIEAAVSRIGLPGREFMGMSIQAAICFLLAACLTTIASFGCWWFGHRVWVDPALHDARRQKAWPPCPTFTTNRVGTLLTSTMITWLVPLAIAALFLAFPEVGPRRQPRAGEDFWLPIVLFGVMISGAILILYGREALIRRVAAAFPEECWPEAAHPWYLPE